VETILLVEDETAVRQSTGPIPAPEWLHLVIEAKDGIDALRIAKNHANQDRPDDHGCRHAQSRRSQTGGAAFLQSPRE